MRPLAVAWQGLQPSMQLAVAAVFVLVLAVQLVLYRRLARRNRRLADAMRDAATRDSLTGLPSRRNWEREARRQAEQAHRYERPLALIVLDVDEFASFNEDHGEHAGDAVLSTIGGWLTDVVRASDAPVRLADDEFAVLLPETPLGEARLVARSLCGRISRLGIAADDEEVRVTVSVGVAAMPPTESFDELLVGAEDALHVAKHSGRNHVELAGRALVHPLRS